MFLYLTRFCGRLTARLALDHNVEVDEFFCEGGHVVFKAERILSNCVSGEDVVPLPFTLAIKDILVFWILDFKIYIKGSAGLDCEIKLRWMNEQ